MKLFKKSWLSILFIIWVGYVSWNLPIVNSVLDKANAGLTIKGSATSTDCINNTRQISYVLSSGGDKRDDSPSGSKVDFEVNGEKAYQVYDDWAMCDEGFAVVATGLGVVEGGNPALYLRVKCCRIWGDRIQ
jgi:hypothetical protein